MMKAMLYPPKTHLQAVEIILTALKDLRRTWMHTGSSDQRFAICCCVNTRINQCDLDNRVRILRLWEGMSFDAYQTWPYWTGNHNFPVPCNIRSVNANEPDEPGMFGKPTYICEYHEGNYWTGEYGQMRGALLEHLIEYFSEERSYAQQQAATCKQGFAPNGANTNSLQGK